MIKILRKVLKMILKIDSEKKVHAASVRQSVPGQLPKHQNSVYNIMQRSNRNVNIPPGQFACSAF